MSIARILAIMEDVPASTMASEPSIHADAGMLMMPGDEGPPDGAYVDEGECPPDPELLSLAQELVVRAGGADRARDLIGKIQDVQEVLEVTDSDVISNMADMIPDQMDLPTGGMAMGMSQAFGQA